VDERNARIAALLGPIGADWALLTGADSVCYATGHEAPAGAGPSPFAGGPSLAAVGRDGRTALVVEASERGPAEGLRADLVLDYDGFAPDPAGPSLERLYGEAVRAMLDELGVGGTVAVEPAGYPAAMRPLLDGRIAGLADVTSSLRAARAVKTAAEIVQLRACAALTGIGQNAAREALAPGRTELEVFGAIRAALDAAEGGPAVLASDLLSGSDRTAAAMGPPGPRMLAEGDPVICDLVPRSGGYWGDSCSTWVLGEPRAGLGRLYAAARAGLDRAVETLRPGITAGSFADGVYAAIEAAGGHDPIHAGHGIGTSNFEHPRLVRGARALLEPGMVLMVEPGAYAARVGGVRLEWMFLVTETGNEVLSPYPIEAVLTPA
jgi:Xaa-Pro aminopeptidase